MTNTRLIHAATCLAATLLFACLPQAPQEGDGGAGGAGGSRVDGGLEDAGGGGEGGGCADCACDEIEAEATCVSRDDCAARYDVFGEFADCRDAGEAMCRALDPDQCGAREECEWADDACRERPIECDEYDRDDHCVEGGCYWWADACHDERQPRRCDQPDAASCEAAACEWTARGCREPLPECPALGREACMARPECRFIGGECQDDPGHLECADLGEMDCLVRGDCGWGDEGCVELRHGDCDDLDERMCIARPDCVPEYAHPECVDCEPVFVACQGAEVDCHRVPVEACERTPGCEVVVDECNCPPGADCDCEERERCVPAGPGPCEALTPAMCARDARCRVEEREICAEGAEAGDADGFRAPEPDEPPPPCRLEQICVEREVPPGECERLDADRCEARDDCELVEDGCECEMPEPAPCDCADGDDCVCAQPVPPPCDCDVVCRPVERRECEDLGIDRCGDREDCEWIGGRGICECFEGPNGEEICECEDEGLCQPRRPRGCPELGADACLDNAECVLEWVDPPCHCDPDEAGDREECVCDPVPFCRDAAEYCRGLGADACGDDEWCAWVEEQACAGGGAPAPCDDDEPCEDLPIAPPECEEVAICLPAAWACWDMDPEACEDAPHCHLIDAGGDCACAIGEDGEEICECGPDEPVCAPRDEGRGEGGGEDGGDPEPDFFP